MNDTLTDTCEIRVSQAYIHLVRQMSGSDGTFHDPAGGLVWDIVPKTDNKADKAQLKAIKSNVQWLKASLKLLGKERVTDEKRKQAFAAYRLDWESVPEEKRHDSQKDADECNWGGMMQRVWLGSEEAMMAAGGSMHIAWKEEMKNLPLPQHLMGEDQDDDEEEKDDEEEEEEEEAAQPAEETPAAEEAAGSDEKA